MDDPLLADNSDRYMALALAIGTSGHSAVCVLASLLGFTAVGFHIRGLLTYDGALLCVRAVSSLQRPRLDVISMPGDNKGVVG
jgi:hypothetical protein